MSRPIRQKEMSEGVEQSENDIDLYVEWEERKSFIDKGFYGRYRITDSQKGYGKNVKIGEKMHCLRCGKTIVKKSAKQRFCSDKCRTRYHNKRTIYA